MSRVAVALSGGVDSSVAAAILHEAGHEVIGVTLRMQRAAPLRHTVDDGISRARLVASHLGIAFDVVDTIDLFTSRVLAPAWADYAAGRTPSPCVQCNPHVKIDALLHWAEKHAIDYIATGHYARVEVDDLGKVHLRRAADRSKDQSYFLAGMNATQLARLFLPLGDLDKIEVRARARALDLPTAHARESQDACFVAPGQPVAERLRNHFAGSSAPGPIVDIGGRTIGQHPGIHRFTVGQRRGLGLQTLQRHWVLRIDAPTRTVVVTPNASDLDGTRLRSSRTTWIDDTNPAAGTAPGATAKATSRCLVQIRSTHKAAPAAITHPSAGIVDVVFDAPVRAITPGQAAVFYAGDHVLGQGWIDCPSPDVSFG
ncbi:MAG: tRNA 2-thiouridine(34) synthase MnmA [Deltaproteobacteria bacterium]|nr:tRNA 2-thiouridine(34) synthase MnmA [Deltaproteobacteria bacterium]